MVDSLQNIALFIIIGILIFDARNIKRDKPDK